MALFQVDIQKQYQQTFWTNVYHVRADSVSQSLATVNLLVDAEAEIHHNTVLIQKARVSTAAAGDDTFTTVNYNRAGERIGNVELLPLFNTLRIDVNTASGRPSRKYYRGVLSEGDIVGNQITASFANVITLLVDAFATDASDSGYVDVDDQEFISAVIFPRVQMRQLRRGSRKRTTPVI